MTLPLVLYGAATRLAGPALLARATRRLAAAGVPATRLAERDGRATATRPTGPLVWLHGASVGETLSLLPLLPRLDLPALVTSGTPASAEILARRLPDTAIHQFAPLDRPAAVRRFLEHWNPDLAILAESEIWPRLIRETARRAIPLALVNARLSARSLARWGRMPATARTLFGAFDLVTVQDDATAAGLAPFLARPPAHRGNLKAAGAPPPADGDKLALYRGLGRPLWIASSTHEGEDAPVLDAHAQIRAAHPDALLILAPRHPERGPAIAALATGLFPTRRLGAGERPDPDTAVLIADTIGDTGTWYRLGAPVFLAGSWGKAGGHNPWEPVACGAPLLHGPRVPNAAADYARLREQGAATPVADASALARAVIRLLGDPEARAAAEARARAAATGADALADAVAADLRSLLRRQGPGGG